MNMFVCIKPVLPRKNVMQNGQNSVAGSEAINAGMSGIIEKLLKSVTGNSRALIPHQF